MRSDPRPRFRWLCADCLTDLRPSVGDGRVDGDLQVVDAPPQKQGRRKRAA